MRKLTLPLLGFAASGVMALPMYAQQIDNTSILPDAKPGECYAKVIISPQFDITTEEVVIQESSERIETVDAVYNAVEKSVVTKEAFEELVVTEAVFETQEQLVEVRSPERGWTTQINGQTLPANPVAVDQISASGVELGSIQPGSCFNEYFIEAKYETQTEEVLIREASERITIVPAKFETVEETIEIKEAAIEVIDVPAIYRSETESVLVEPARNVWEHCGLVERSDDTASEIMCLNRIPERYETLTKTVLDTAASTEEVTVAAVTETVEVLKLVEPAIEVREEVPAVYETVNTRVKVADAVFFWLASDAEAEAGAVRTGRIICLEELPAELVSLDLQMVSEPASTEAVAVPETAEIFTVEELVSPGSQRQITIPEQTRTITSRVATSPGLLEWRQIICEVDLTPELAVSVQQALDREGYNPGPIDGIIGRLTLNAMEQYQFENNLGRGGVTYEALEQLGVSVESS